MELERFDELELPDMTITSALSVIPQNFASQEEVIAFLKNPLFQQPPEEQEEQRTESFLREGTISGIFDNIRFFYFRATGMSIIVYGENLDSPGKFCVVKFIHPQHLEGVVDDDKVKTVRRFRREIEFLYRNQKNPLWIPIQKIVAEPYPFFSDFSQRYPCLVLEFCPGINCHDFCTAPAFSGISSRSEFLSAFALASLRIFADVASEKRVFRDFKPENVLITPRGFIFLDPGSITEEGSDLTSAERVIGTPVIMSPEQAQNYPLDFRSDLYSLGVCLFFLATKKFPFDGADGMEILQKHIADPVPAEQLNHLPSSLRAAILRLLEKDFQDRFSSLEEAADHFRPFVCGTEMEVLLPPTLLHRPSFMPTALDE